MSSQVFVREKGALVVGGSARTGTWSEEPVEANLLDALQPGMIGATRLGRYTRLKEWQHYAVATPQHYVAVALFDSKLAGVAQVVLLDRASGETHVWEKTLAPGSLRTPQSIYAAAMDWSDGTSHIHFENNLQNGYHKVSWDVQGKTVPAMRGDIKLIEDLSVTRPLVVCLPLGETQVRQPVMYSHKAVVPAQGSLSVDRSTASVDSAASYGLIDIHKGYYPRIMQWHWVCAGLQTPQGPWGINLTDNQVVDQTAYNENCLWRPGHIDYLPPVKFEVPPASSPMTPWHIRSADGAVDLTFSPVAERRLERNMLIVQNRYRSPYGMLSGTVRTAGGLYQISDYFGMCEDFWLKS